MTRIGKNALCTLIISASLFFMSGCSDNNVKHTIEMLKQNQNEAVRIDLIRRISLEAKDGMLEKLFPFLSDREEMGATADTLLGFLETGSLEVKKETIIAVGDLQDKRATKSLIKVIESDDNELRKFAIEALGKIRDKEAVPFLLSYLNTEGDIGYVIIWALGNIGDSRAVPALTALLNHHDSYVRYNAFNALKDINRGPS
ncbi:MAG: HEAT repeat domain-containing protein [Nitrospiraceae bacterium]|nr:MAG: HEAT repeat domain-containing protein [Nitrospiraceae bacterium]